MIKELIVKNRSYRRFYQDAPLELDSLRELVDCARLSASGRNAQPLKYILSADPEKNARIFPHLAWAGYLTDWPGPVEGERPAGYIVFLGDTQITPNFGIDPGIAVQSMLLAAAEKGLGGCIVASVDRAGLRETLGIPERYEVIHVLALGKPKESVVLEPLPADGSIR